MIEGHEPRLSPLAVKILTERYLLRDQEGRVIETPGQMYLRVAETMGRQEKTPRERLRWTETFFKGLINLEWSPASPCLMNAGTPLQQLSACFILDIADSMENIFTTLKDAALIYKTGGGVGFHFGRLREKGALISTTKGISGGTTAWLKVYDTAVEAIAQGGKRRGAALGVLPVNHPDILDWTKAKSRDREMTNFNLSVAVNEEFMLALELDQEIALTSPLGYTTGKMKTRTIWGELTHQAWAAGEPGLFFIDRANADNPNPHLGRIYGGNPCGEFLAIPGSSCNLASINLERHLKAGEKGRADFDWDKFSSTIITVVRFLDNMIDANRLPLPYLQDLAAATRPIGLGFMGLARVLKGLRLGYNTPEGLAWTEKMIRHLRREAEKASEELAWERGFYPVWKGSLWEKKQKPIRNSHLLSIAPTGTIATLTNTSWSLEPEFAPIYKRRILEGKVFWEIDPQLEEVITALGIDSPSLREEIAHRGSIQDLEVFPSEIRQSFVYAMDITPADHLKMQAIVQNHVDGAISKTINLPSQAEPQEVEQAFRLAYELGLKGCTVYRQGTRLDQVLTLTTPQEEISSCQGDFCPVC